jgi:hypothetical protein
VATIAPTRVSTERSVNKAFEAIGKKPTLFTAEEWPEFFSGLGQSGLYAWWVDAAGARDLTDGIGSRVKAGCIYAGQAGATTWPAGRASRNTLCSRIEGEQLNGNVARSPFRLTLAAALKKPLKLKKLEASKLAPDSEARLTSWMQEHLSLAVYQCSNKDELTDLEVQVLGQVNPPLNLFSMPPSDVRVLVSKLRSGISGP